MQFHKSQETPSMGDKSRITNKSKLILWLLAAIVCTVIVGYALFSLKLFTDRIITNWDNLKFAMEKPSVVQSLREDYASKSAELEKSLEQKEPTPQDQLIEEVLKQLKSSK